MMMSYGCTTRMSFGLAVKYFYSVPSATGVAAVLADETTITPSGYTSIATVMDRKFAVASPPASMTSALVAKSTDPTAVSATESAAASATSVPARDSSVPASNVHLSTSDFVGIFTAVQIIILGVISACLYLRRRKRQGVKWRSPRCCGLRKQLSKIPPSVAPSSPRDTRMSAYSRPPSRSPRTIEPKESVSQISVPNAPSHVPYQSSAATGPALQDQADQVNSIATGFPFVASPIRHSFVPTGVGLGTELDL